MNSGAHFHLVPAHDTCTTRAHAGNSRALPQGKMEGRLQGMIDLSQARLS